MPRVQLATDNFNRADSADLGANWDTYTGWNNLQIVTNEVYPGAAGGSETLESYNAVAFANNQYAKVLIVSSPSTSDSNGAAVRAAVPPTQSAYTGVMSGTAGDGVIAKWVAGVYTSLASVATGFVAGNTVALEVVGTTLELFKNDVSILLTTDSSLASGRAGLEVFVDLVPLSDQRADTWEAGNIVPVAEEGGGRAGLPARSFAGLSQRYRRFRS